MFFLMASPTRIFQYAKLSGGVHTFSTAILRSVSYRLLEDENIEMNASCMIKIQFHACELRFDHIYCLPFYSDCFAS